MTTIAYDIITSSDPAFSFGAANVLVTVNLGVVVLTTSFGGTGISSSFANDKLVNNGFISGAALHFGAGVSFTGVNGAITNNVTGMIRGAGNGIMINADGGTIVNHGTIIGLETLGVSFETNAANGVLTNHGLIVGKINGVLAGNNTKVTNTGTIRSEGKGVGASSGAPTIDNSGKIEGGDVAVGSSFASRVALTNNKGGLIDGKIDFDGTGGSHTVFNKGTITSETRLGPGNDTFTFAKGKQGSVFGETGADNFNFVSGLAKKKDAAVIGDFAPGEDTIGLSKKLFKGIGKEGELKKKYFEVGKKAKDKDDHVIWNKAKGNLFYDKDGKGGGGQKLVAKLTPDIDLKASDILVIA